MYRQRWYLLHFGRLCAFKLTKITISNCKTGVCFICFLFSCVILFLIPFQYTKNHIQTGKSNLVRTYSFIVALIFTTDNQIRFIFSQCLQKNHVLSYLLCLNTQKCSYVDFKYNTHQIFKIQKCIFCHTQILILTLIAIELPFHLEEKVWLWRLYIHG